jgi:hypothetical protein
MDVIGTAWKVPTTIPDPVLTKLSAEVCFKVSPTGALLKYDFRERSGNSQFDSSLDAALSTTRTLPPPPERFASKTFCMALSAPGK